MHRVMRHIEENLAAPLELAELARVANFSPYHFHRLFAAWTGERVGDFVRRRRLEVAAMRLVTQPASTVLEVALSVGFGSSEAFSRSFRSHFSESPSAWRRRQRNRGRHGGNPGRHDRNPDQGPEGPLRHDGVSSPPPQEPVMNVRLVNLDPVEVAYMRHVGPYGAPIATFWMETVAPWMHENGLMRAARYGISHDDPSVTSPEKCRYDACVEAPPDLVLSGAVQRLRLPGGRYATTDFEGSASAVGDAWASLLRDWLPGSGLQMDHRPCFEYYPPERAGGQREDDFFCTICIPVARL